MRTIHVESVLAADAERVWPAMLAPATLAYVCRGVLGMPVFARRTQPWSVGERTTLRLWLFHVIPGYRHTLEFVEIDEGQGIVRTHEHGGVLAAWDHTLRVEAIDAGSCRYSDTVGIDAGRLTGVVAALAIGFYRYRQRRWRKLIHRLPTGADTG